MDEVTWQTSGNDTVEVFKAADGWHWHCRAANGEIVGQGEAHPDRRAAVKAAERHHPRVDEP